MELIGKIPATKLLDYIYFNIYSWYYNVKTDGRKVDPTGLTSFVIGVCIGGWIFLLDSIFPSLLQKLTSGYHKLILIILAILFTALVNEIYTKNARYVKIYNQHTTSDIVKNKGLATLLSLFLCSATLYSSCDLLDFSIALMKPDDFDKEIYS